MPDLKRLDHDDDEITPKTPKRNEDSMAKRQAELPNIRLPGDGAPQKPIKALDDATDALEKAKGNAIRAAQAVVGAKKIAQDLLLEHNLPSYEYETADGKLKKIFRKETLGSCKVKVAKRTDDDTDDGDDE